MSDLILSTATRTQLELRAAVAHLHRWVERLQSEENGQDMIEYAGVIVIVALIIGAVVLLVPGIKSSLSSGISKQINNIFSH